MFSSRMFAALALAVAVVAYPADQDFFPRPITTLADPDFDDGASWWSFPSLETFFAPILNLFPTFSEIGPKIEIDDKQFRVIMNAKGYKKDDLKVIVKNDFILVKGAHEAKDSAHDLFATQFFHTYSLPPNASASDVTARLYSDGYLILTALLKGADLKTKETEVEVPIIEESEPFRKKDVESTEKPEVPASPVNPEVPVLPAEVDNKTEGTTNLPTTVPDADDRKEQTTPSDKEEVTEKDNSIPHGPEAIEANELNEVQP